MTDDDRPIFERGDVVYGDDPFKPDEAARPWLVVSNHEGRPFHGEQYLALTLTTRSWMDGLVEIPEQAWIRGGTPATSRIVPWGIQSLARSDIDRWQGRLRDVTVNEAVDALVAELRR
ncbi:growth inhibitor [Halorubrum saccharovorum]|uniref:Growth inhibitor n=1 Tax=Halorubrum saccharovorum TaxID=2248 RepID=A0A081ETJ2_9EURY|nr:growth inhibitor [Halorubrum saccharovorum]KDS90730.1 growth inhibitor [Halorubrum saccharovorum]